MHLNAHQINPCLGTQNPYDMITAENRIKESNFAHIYDFDSVKPDGCREFHAFIWFTDLSHTLWSKIFAIDREHVFGQIIHRFGDCLNYVDHISIDEDE